MTEEGRPRIETELEDGVGKTVHTDPDSLDEYEFGIGDYFVRWHPWGDERADGDVWVVTNVSWQFKTTWVRDRDDPTTSKDHRQYTLLSRENMATCTFSEKELMWGDWKQVDESEVDSA